MEVKEKEIQDFDIRECVAELNSYCAILADYIDAHEGVEELLHASLLVEKMQERITELYNIYYE